MVLAEVYREQREYERAVATYQRVLEEMPSNADAAHGLGDCLANLGRREEAAAALTRAQKLNPGSAAILYSLGQLPSGASRPLSGKERDIIMAITQ